MARTAAAGGARAASSSTPRPSRTGLQLAPDDPGDARIIDRQRKAARAAGRAGQDRTAVTQGRTDLEEAFDEGAAAGDDEDQVDPGPGRGRRAFTSAADIAGRGSWSPTLHAPARARDAGGLLVGLLLYTATITYIRYGVAGWRGWLSAKFLNKPLQGAAKTAGATGGPSDSSGRLAA